MGKMMIYMCDELEAIINKKKIKKQIINYSSLLYEIFKIYNDEFGLSEEDIEAFNEETNMDVDIELYSDRFMSELVTDFPDGISSIFDVLEKPFHKDCDIQFDLKSKGISLRKVINVKERIESEDKFINDYTIKINKKVMEQDINIVERDNELVLLEIFLSMKNKNNVLITGKPGVGKTALVEALAKKIESGDVKTDLLGKQILSVDVARLLGNTKYRGEFEEKLTRLLDISVKREYILFIDEAHIVMGAGASEGGISASNILKPYLLKDNLKFICATTEEEYLSIVKDKAFNRRFNAIYLREFSENQMQIIGEILCTPYEKFHNVLFQKKDIVYIVNYLSSEKYSEKFFPDKFIEFVDFIGSYYSDEGLINREQIDNGFDFYEKSRILVS